MKTFSYSVTYHYEESGEIDAPSYEDAQSMIEELTYVVGEAGYSVPWDYVQFHELHEIDDDGEDAEEDEDD
jgi:hypothetical protein